MKTCPVLLLLLLVVGAPQVEAQCVLDVAPVDSKTPAPSPPDIIELVIRPTVPMTTKVLFVVDTSGSMDSSGRMGMALSFSRGIMSNPTDQMLIALISFKESHARWPGVPHNPKEDGPNPPPKGWTYFPGADRLAKAQKWLNDRGASGDTNPVSALTEALAEKVESLTIVFITDGEDFDVPAFKKAIADGQAARIKAKLGKAAIFVIGTGEEAAQQKHLREVAKTEGGGLFVIKRPKPPEEPKPKAPLLPPDPHGPRFDDDWSPYRDD